MREDIKGWLIFFCVCTFFALFWFALCELWPKTGLHP